MFSFDILLQSKKSKARLGKLQTPHGSINTPAFVPCATKATIKALSQADLVDLKTQLVFVNTYHMVLSPGLEVLKKAGGIHAFSNSNVPVITDSGGFQVFSLARRSHAPRDEGGPLARQSPRGNGGSDASPHLVKITDDGVRFKSHTDGTEYFFTPEFSIEAQMTIGADFMVAFDECVPADSTYNYTKKSLARTHDWARRSLSYLVANNSLLRTELTRLSRVQTSSPRANVISSLTKDEEIKVGEKQKMFGVVQGGRHEDLRKESAEFIAGLPFFGIALGGVSVGETRKELEQEISWMM